MDAEAGFKQLVNDELTRAKMLQERAEKGDDPWDRIEYTVTEKCRVKESRFCGLSLRLKTS